MAAIIPLSSQSIYAINIYSLSGIYYTDLGANTIKWQNWREDNIFEGEVVRI